MDGARLSIRDTSAQDRVLMPSSASVQWRRWRWAAAALAALTIVVLLLPTLARIFSAERSFAAERLRFAVVERGVMLRDIAVQGRVVAAVSPTLYAPAAGTVSFRIQAGDVVEEGQVLGVLSSPELENELSREQSSLQGLEIQVARARIDNRKQELASARIRDDAEVALLAARREMQRAEAAWKTRSISEVDYLRAQDALRTAELGHAHANADAGLERESLAFELRSHELSLERQQLLVEDLRRRVDELNIRAPVPGRVGTLLVADRTAVGRDQGIVTVIDLSRLEVEIDAPESLADELAPGMAGEIIFQGRGYAAELASISPEVVAGQVRARLRFAADQPGGLRQNQRLSARVLMDERDDVLKVARGPFVDAGGGRYAYVVRDGIAERRMIQVGTGSLTEIEIISGLAEGERIVISGTDAFENAERVLIN